MWLKTQERTIPIQIILLPLTFFMDDFFKYKYINK